MKLKELEISILWLLAEIKNCFNCTTRVVTETKMQMKIQSAIIYLQIWE